MSLLMIVCAFAYFFFVLVWLVGGTRFIVVFPHRLFTPIFFLGFLCFIVASGVFFLLHLFIVCYYLTLHSPVFLFPLHFYLSILPPNLFFFFFPSDFLTVLEAFVFDHHRFSHCHNAYIVPCSNAVPWLGSSFFLLFIYHLGFYFSLSGYRIGLGW